MSATMRAYQLLGVGRPQVVEIPVPEPGPGQVRLKTAGAGLCHSDLSVIHADPPYFNLPTILGHEATGWIDKVGENVVGLTIGDAYGVYFPWGCGHCLPCAYGKENVCDQATATPGFGSGCDGGMADYFIVDDPRHLIPLGRLDPVDAAPLMCAGITTYHAVKDGEHLLGAGSTAVVIGIGGLGHLAIQILKALTPAKVIAVDRQLEKLAHALELGADHSIAAGAAATAEIRALTGGLGAAVVIDLVGNDVTLAFAQSILAQGSQMKIVGVGGGTLALRFHEMPRDASVSVPYAGSITDLIEVVRLAEAGLVTPDVIHIGYDAMAATYALMDTGKLRGRAILVPGRA